MEQEKNKNGIIIILVIIIVILLALVVLLATDTIDFKSNEVNNENNNSNSTTNSSTNSVQINNITFDKPLAGGYGGDTTWTLMGNMTVDFTCTDDSVMAITIEGYCLDKNDNKYLFRAPEGATMFYCGQSNKGMTQATKIIKKDGNNYEIPNETIDQGIKWDEIEIKYCKFDKANLILPDYSKSDTQIELNYEKEFN